MKRSFSPASSSQAFEWADQWALELPAQQIPLAQAAGYRLAQPLIANSDIPRHVICARDGYALHSADSLGAGDYNPLPLRVVSAAQRIRPGCAALVCAGDRLPQSADAVLSQQQLELRSGFIDVGSSLAPADGVIEAGEECRENSELLAAGRRLRAQDLAWLAQAGIDQVSVQSKPQVLLCVAGHFTRDANSSMLAALLQRDGAELLTGVRTHSKEQLGQLLSQNDADLILVVGGTGYAEHDYALQALNDVGRVELDGVTIHPGGAVVLGRVANRPVILLPGTPLSCLCAYDLIVARLIRRLAGLPGILPYPVQEFTLARKLVSRIGQLELARMRIDGETTQPLAVADDRLLASSVQAHGFVLLAENSEGYAVGSRVKVYLYDNQV